MMGSSSAATPAREPLVGEKGRGDRYKYIPELRTEPPSRAVGFAGSARYSAGVRRLTP